MVNNFYSFNDHFIGFKRYLFTDKCLSGRLDVMCCTFNQIITFHIPFTEMDFLHSSVHKIEDYGAYMVTCRRGRSDRQSGEFLLRPSHSRGLYLLHGTGVRPFIFQHLLPLTKPNIFIFLIFPSP